MPRYNVTDPESGKSLVLEGDSPPTEQELVQIFGTVAAPTKTGTAGFTDTDSGKELVINPDVGKAHPTMPATAGGPRTPVASAAETMVEPMAAAKEFATAQPLNLPRFDIKETDHPMVQIGKEALNVAAGVPEFMASPLGVASIGAGMVSAPAVAAAFTVDTLKSIGEQVWSTYKNWPTMTTAERRKAIVDITASGEFGLLMGHSAARPFQPKPFQGPIATGEVLKTPVGAKPAEILKSAAEQAKPVAPMTAAAVEAQTGVQLKLPSFSKEGLLDKLASSAGGQIDEGRKFALSAYYTGEGLAKDLGIDIRGVGLLEKAGLITKTDQGYTLNQDVYKDVYQDLEKRGFLPKPQPEKGPLTAGDEPYDFGAATRESKKKFDEAISASAGADAVEMKSPQFPNLRVVITREPSEPGKWRATRIDQKGPSGHNVYNTFEEAISDYTGGHKTAGPSWGWDFKVTNIRKLEKGAPDAIPERSPAPLPVGETPEVSGEVGTRIPEPAQPALPQAEAAQGAGAVSQAAPEVTPAIQVAGKVFTGKDHLDAYAKAKEGGQPDTSGAIEGFVDSDGKFISRQEAAQTTGLPTNTEPGKLHSSDLPASTEGQARVLPVEPPTPKEPWQTTKADFTKNLKQEAQQASENYDRVFRESERAHKDAAGVAGYSAFDDPVVQQELKVRNKAESALRRAEKEHEKQVKAAVKSGSPVPPEVLADYPNLKPPAPKPVVEEGGKGDRIQKAAEEVYRVANPEEELAKFPPEQRAAAEQRARERALGYATKVITAIDNKDLKYLESVLHGGNKITRGIFERETGVDLGSTLKDSTAAIRKWAGEEIFDKYRADLEAERAARKSAEEEKTKQSRIDAALNKPYRYAMGGAGVSKVVTARELIDDLVARGFTNLSEAKRGAFPVLRMMDEKGAFHEFRTKAEMDYARRKVAESKPKPPETPPQAAAKVEAGKAPKVGEAFARIGDYEFALIKGDIPERPDMYGVGIRRVGSTMPFESGGYGHRVKPEQVLNDWAEKEIQSGSGEQTQEFKHPAAEAAWKSESERLAKLEADRQAAETAKRQAEEVKQNRWQSYKSSVQEVELPTGKKTTISAPSKEGKQIEVQGTAYGDWLLSKNPSKYDESPYFVSHIPSGLRVSGDGFSTMAGAKDYIKALNHAELPTKWKNKSQLSKADIEKFKQVGKAWLAGGDVPDYFKPQPPPEKGPGMVGMGGAIPEEFKPSAQSATSLKNAVVDRERAQRGLPPMMAAVKKSWGPAWEKAMSVIDADPGFQTQLIKELLDKPRALEDWENAALLQRRVDLRNEYAKATRDAAQAYDDGRLDAVAEAKARIANWSDQLAELERATGKGGAGTESGRSLAARKMMMNEDFSLASLETQARVAKNFEPLTDTERAELKKIADEHKARADELEKHLAERDAKLAEMQSREQHAKLKAEESAAKAPSSVIIKLAEKIVAELDSKADAARARIKARMGQFSAGVDPTVILDLAEIGASHIGHIGLDFAKWSEKMVSDVGEWVKPHLEQVFAASQKKIDEFSAKTKHGIEVAGRVKQAFKADTVADVKGKVSAAVKKGENDKVSFFAQKLARTFIKQGITEREANIDAVHDVLKDMMPDWSRRDTMDAISGYGKFRQLTKDQISVQLRAIKGEMQQIAKLEDMAEGIPPRKTGMERREISEEERKLIKAVNEAKFKFQVPITDPATQLKSALDTRKTQLANKAKDLQERIDKGDFSPRPARRVLQLDSEALRLQSELDKVERKFRAGVRAQELANRKPWQRALDAFVKWERAFKLSSPVVFGKLTSAAVTRLVTTASEEGMGALLGRFPGINEVARRAPREGGVNVKAMAHAINAAMDAGMRDAGETARSGMSELERAFGGKEQVDPDWANFFGQLHGMMKAPIKRAEFTLAREKRIEFAIRNGVDVTDPMVEARINIEALEDGWRSIFMQHSFAADMFNQLVSQMESSKKYQPVGEVSARMARFLLPIVRVPMNIVGETFTGATGSISGTARMLNVMRRGIDTLKPEEADLIMRNLKKGSIGLALMAIGYFNPQFAGGYDWREKRGKKDAKTGGFKIRALADIPVINLLVDKEGRIPRWATHAPWFELMQLGATVRHVKDQHVKGQDKGITEGLWAGALGLTEETPFVGQMLRVDKIFEGKGPRDAYLGELTKSTVSPALLQQAAALPDNLQDIKRRPKTFTEHVKMGVPGLRETVPIDTRNK